MTIMNRRNAIVGFLTLKVGKVVARRKAKQVGDKLTPWRKANDKKTDKKSDKRDKSGKSDQSEKKSE
jgi:hypothetical protein